MYGSASEDESDLLTGYAAIGAFLGWTARQAKHRALSGELPTFPIGRTPHARKSSLKAWLSKREAEARKPEATP